MRRKWLAALLAALILSGCGNTAPGGGAGSSAGSGVSTPAGSGDAAGSEALSGDPEGIPAESGDGAGALLRRAIEDARRQGRKGLVLTCKERLVAYYAGFGFADEGVTGKSTHGGAVWHQMRLRF